MTVTYTLDGMVGQPLVIANSAETTLILYGRYAIGEYKVQAAAGEQWHYYLGDAELSVRQLVDGSGLVLLARTYAPFGILLAQAGSGVSLFDYAGGQAGVSGLWYFGSGYFDPQTGQFLAQETNPLAPLAASVLANPGGLLFGPLLLWNWRRRKKGGKLPPTGLFVLALLFTVGLVGCGGETVPPTTEGAPALPPEIDPTQEPTASPTWIPTAIPTVVVAEITVTPECTEEPTVTSTATPTVILIVDPQPTITHDLNDIVKFSVSLKTTPTATPITDETNDIEWTEAEKKVVREGAGKVARKFAEILKLDHPSWDVDQTPNKAFLMVYGGPIWFVKTGQSCEQATTHRGCWGKTINGNQIDVYIDSNIRDSEDKNSYYWTIHELGHAFNYALSPNQTEPNYTHGQGLIDLAQQGVYEDIDGDGEKDDLLAGAITPGSWLGDYRRDLSRGYQSNTFPYIQDDVLTANEDFADMFSNYIYNSFALDKFGIARYDLGVFHLLKTGSFGIV